MHKVFAQLIDTLWQYPFNAHVWHNDSVEVGKRWMDHLILFYFDCGGKVLWHSQTDTLNYFLIVGRFFCHVHSFLNAHAFRIGVRVWNTRHHFSAQKSLWFEIVFLYQQQECSSTFITMSCKILTFLSKFELFEQGKKSSRHLLCCNFYLFHDHLLFHG